MTKFCSIPNCEKKHKARGFCHMHYWRWLEYGDPLGGGTFQGEPMRWIEDIAMNYKGSDCLIWPFAKDKGYSRIKIGKRMYPAHRYICEEIYGPPPKPEYEAAHSCGNGHLGCVNPNHLSWKTSKENSEDTIIHGRTTRGEKHSNVKLTESNVREIRVLSKTMEYKDIARRFGVKGPAISKIVRGERWGWLK